jgi:hypothetical protein
MLQCSCKARGAEENPAGLACSLTPCCSRNVCVTARPGWDMSPVVDTQRGSATTAEPRPAVVVQAPAAVLVGTSGARAPVAPPPPPLEPWWLLDRLSLMAVGLALLFLLCGVLCLAYPVVWDTWPVLTRGGWSAVGGVYLGVGLLFLSRAAARLYLVAVGAISMNDVQILLPHGAAPPAASGVATAVGADSSNAGVGVGSDGVAAGPGPAASTSLAARRWASAAATAAWGGAATFLAAVVVCAVIIGGDFRSTCEPSVCDALRGLLDTAATAGLVGCGVLALAALKVWDLRVAVGFPGLYHRQRYL